MRTTHPFDPGPGVAPGLRSSLNGANSRSPVAVGMQQQPQPDRPACVTEELAPKIASPFLDGARNNGASAPHPMPRGCGTTCFLVVCHPGATLAGLLSQVSCYLGRYRLPSSLRDGTDQTQAESPEQASNPWKPTTTGGMPGPKACSPTLGGIASGRHCQWEGGAHATNSLDVNQA